MLKELAKKYNTVKEFRSAWEQAKGYKPTTAQEGRFVQLVSYKKPRPVLNQAGKYEKYETPSSNPVASPNQTTSPNPMIYPKTQTPTIPQLSNYQLPDEDKIRQEEIKRTQAMIDALNSYYNEELGRIRDEGRKALQQTSTIAVGAGLAGSPFKQSLEAKTQAYTDKQLEAKNKEKAMRIQELLGQAEDKARERYLQDYEIYKQEQKDYLNQLKQQQEETKNNIQSIASAGYSYNDLTDEQKKYLKDRSGLSELEISALFKNYAPQSDVSYKVLGDKILTITKDATGKITTDVQVIPGLEEKPDGTYDVQVKGDNLLLIPSEVNSIDDIIIKPLGDQQPITQKIGDTLLQYKNGSWQKVYTPSVEGSNSVENWAKNVLEGYATMSNVPSDLRNEVNNRITELKNSTLTPKQVDAVKTLRKQITSEDTYKTLSQIRNGYQNVKIGRELANAQGDLAIVNGIAKMLDPTGVVRPAEFNTVEEAQGFFEKMMNVKEKIWHGDRLKDNVRDKFLDLANELYKTKIDFNRKALEGVYKPLIENYNVDIKDVLPEFYIEEESKSEQQFDMDIIKKLQKKYNKSEKEIIDILKKKELSMNIKKIADAIGKFESGGNYKAIGKKTSSGDRAYGKYQIMGRNIPAWSKEILGRAVSIQEFLNNPKIQDAIAMGKMQQYYNRYKNPADVASLWFSGRPVSKAGNSRDINGTTVPQYVKNVLKNLYG